MPKDRDTIELLEKIDDMKEQLLTLRCKDEEIDQQKEEIYDEICILEEKIMDAEMELEDSESDLEEEGENTIL